MRSDPAVHNSPGPAQGPAAGSGSILCEPYQQEIEIIPVQSLMIWALGRHSCLAIV